MRVIIALGIAISLMPTMPTRSEESPQKVYARPQVVQPVSQPLRPVEVVRPATGRPEQVALLQQKLAVRDRLQREITKLQTATETPENVLVQVTILEINRTKIRQTGLELSLLGESKTSVDITPLLRGYEPIAASASKAHPGFATIDNASLVGVFDMLEKQQFAKTIAAPSIVTTSGQSASIKIGGEIPVPPAEQGGAATAKEYGTQLDVTATTLGDNKVRLAVHPRVCEIDATRGIKVRGQTVPAMSIREVSFSGEIEFGRSMLISGVAEQRHIAKPGWSFRKTEEFHEIALVIVVTPEIVR
jgi:pilus assembly protein CpaC